MEEKKIDVQSIIGFILIGGILLWMLYNNTPDETESVDEVTTEENINRDQETTPEFEENTATPASDSTALVMLKNVWVLLDILKHCLQQKEVLRR